MKSALNSVVAEKSKVVKPKKSEKMKDGKSLKNDKKVDKKVDGVKKNDVKKVKKVDSEKFGKKQVDNDYEEPLVRLRCSHVKIFVCTLNL